MTELKPGAIARGILLLFCLNAVGLAAGAVRPEKPRRDLLTSRWSRESVLRALKPRNEWRPFPRACDRAAWESLLSAPSSARRLSAVIKKAEGLRGFEWPPLPAVLYMEFVRNGNRSHYEDRYFRRREALSALVIAECAEHRGRFLDDIANGVWALCEESTWCLPAHTARYPGDMLPRPDLQSLDLFACETGMTLALCGYLLEDEIKKLSRALWERIGSEVRRRILDPYAAGDSFGCSGWTRGGNNWAPWCASNVMGAAMLLEKDPDRLAGIVHRLMGVADRFINGYGEDGGCDEGPSYWNEAAGSLVVLLELLRSRTSGKIDIYDDPKIAAMGRFITYVHLAGPWFANSADADPRPSLQPGKIYRYGERIGCDRMRNLALLLLRNWRFDSLPSSPLVLRGVVTPLLEPLMELYWIPENAEPKPPSYEPFVWLPDLQLLVSHQSVRSEKGLVLAAKAGHNAESHNHNDVGHFIIFLDGNPGVIDVGRERYTRQTFSSKRYELWFTRGSAHNAPVVNGVEQRAGGRYRATNVRFENRNGNPYLSMQLERAYPPEAGLELLRREITFRRTGEPEIEIHDGFRFKGPKGELSITLYTVRPVQKTAARQVSIALSPRPLRLEIETDKGVLPQISIEPVAVTDDILKRGWGPRLWKTVIKIASSGPAGGYTLKFKAASSR